MINFEKVSFEQFKKDSANLLSYLSEDEVREVYDKIELPKRGSAGSAGYDFHVPIDVQLKPGSIILIPTGIKAQMPKNVVLMIYPRSSVGFKSGTYLSNSTAIIDQDYYNNENNEGHIMIKLVGGFSNLSLKSGDRFVQGIFTNYLTTDDDDVTSTREGGIGSTGK